MKFSPRRSLTLSAQFCRRNSSSSWNFYCSNGAMKDAIGTAGQKSSQIGQWPPVALGRLRIRFSREALPIHQNKAEGSPIRRTFLVRRCTPEQLISAEANADPNFTAF